MGKTLNVENGRFDLSVVDVKIYLLVRVNICIGTCTFISLADVNIFKCFECRKNLSDHTGLNKQGFVAVSRFHRDLSPGIRVA